MAYRCYKCRAIKSLPAGKAAGEFLMLLDRLTVGRDFKSEFQEVLKDEWVRRTGDSAAVVTRLKAKLVEREEAQTKLVEAYLRKEPEILSVFSRMNARFEEEISTIKAQIEEANITEASFEHMWEFSQTMLADIPTAWARPISTKNKEFKMCSFRVG